MRTGTKFTVFWWTEYILSDWANHWTITSLSSYRQKCISPTMLNWENALICSSRIQLKSGTFWRSFTTVTAHIDQCVSFCKWELNAGGTGVPRPSPHRMMGAERSFVTVGRSFTVAKGFSPLQGKEKQGCRNTTRWKFDFKSYELLFLLCEILWLLYKIPDIFWMNVSLCHPAATELSRAVDTVTGEPTSLWPLCRRGVTRESHLGQGLD